MAPVTCQSKSAYHSDIPMKIRFTFLAGLGLSIGLVLSSCGNNEPESDPSEEPVFSKTTVNKIPGEEEPASTETSDEEVDMTDEEKERMMGHIDKGFEEGDKDGDGYLTQEEIGNLFWVMVHRADEDEDGQVSKEEIKAAAVKESFHQPVEPTKVIEIMDTDSDGFVNAHELPERFQQGIGFADLDGDSKISTLEIENVNAMFSAMRERRMRERREARERENGELDGTEASDL